jgi:hypothetical protein
VENLLNVLRAHDVRGGTLSASDARLDEAKVETLRSWGEGLRNDPREEVRAAGRAITMLVEEIERLNIDLWHARTDPPTNGEAPVRPAREIVSSLLLQARGSGGATA